MASVYDMLLSFQQAGQEFIENYCIVNNNFFLLDDIEKMGSTEFGLRSKFSMPLKLYKYFPNKVVTDKDDDGNETQVNYSLQALETNQVYLNSPDQFDDVFDSDISISWDDYLLFRLKRYARWYGCDVEMNQKIEEVSLALAEKMYLALTEKGSIVEGLNCDGCSEGERLSAHSFGLQVQLELKDTNDWHLAFAKILNKEYNDFIRYVQQRFRVTCFATSPFSQLMWGGPYADCHRGFCIEYTIEPNNPEYKEAYYNLFPMIYCKTRKQVSERLLRIQDADFPPEVLWDIYFYGALRKSIDWAFQNEWRLLLPNTRNSPGFTMPFFPISKVYLGNRMPAEKRKAVIDICHSKNIPYIGVTRSTSRYEMEECKMLCENCPSYARR